MAAILYGDKCLADNVLAKAFDLKIAILEANDAGLYVDTKQGTQSHYVAVWRGSNTQILDTAKAQLILSETL